MASRVAGEHARATTRRLARRLLLIVLGATLGATGLALSVGLANRWFMALEGALIIGSLLLHRFGLPAIDRWDRGATGEEAVGAIVDELRAHGWWAAHDVSLGRGNIDHVLVGVGGIFSIETKGHAGRIAVARLDRRWLNQAYAQRKLLERVTGLPVTPLLVFSRAYLDRPVSRHRGVTVLPARMLAGHLARYPRKLSDAEAEAVHRRLLAAVL